LGVPPEQLPTPEELADPVLGVWPENWPALGLYQRLETQWRMAGMGGPTGIAYGRLEFWLELDRVPRESWPDTVGGLQVIEREILRLARERAASRARR
jgi:hypothetical protein